MGRPLKLDPQKALKLYKKLGTIAAVRRAFTNKGIPVSHSSVWRAIQKTEEGALLMAKNSKHKKQSSAHLRRIGVADIHR
jgi:hypothetical protein